MTLKNILSITEARNNLFKIVDQAQKSSAYFILTERGRAKAVIMSAEEFESWQETVEVMREFPDLDKDIKEVEQDIKTGEYKKYSTLEEVLGEYGFVLADKSKNKYGVSNKNRVKSKKRTGKNS